MADRHGAEVDATRIVGRLALTWTVATLSVGEATLRLDELAHGSPAHE